jgi:hypothetical protein
MWKRPDPRMDRTRFTPEVIDVVKPVKYAWRACEIEHPHYYDRWVRPAWSKTELWAGGFDVANMRGNQTREHETELKGKKQVIPKFSRSNSF